METYTLPQWLGRELLGIAADNIKNLGNSLPLPAVFRSGQIAAIKVGSKGIEVILPGRPRVAQLEGVSPFVAILADDVRDIFGIQSTVDWEMISRVENATSLVVEFDRLFFVDRNGVVMAPFAFLGRDP